MSDVLSIRRLQTNIPQMFDEPCGVCLGKLTGTCFIVTTKEGTAIVCSRCCQETAAP